MAKRASVLSLTRSWVERFWPMGIWIAITVGIYWKTYRSFKTQPQYYYLRTILGYWLCVSRGTAPVLTMCSVLVLVPVCRALHTLLHRLLAGVSARALACWLSRIKTMHAVCASTLICFSWIHTGAHMMNAINFSKHYSFVYPEINVANYKGENPAFLICTWTGCSGIAMLLLLSVIAVTSTSSFRKHYFNYFYVTHHCFIVYLILLLTHPLRGVLKEQYNVDQHTPGCIFYGNRTVKSEEGFPEPTDGHKGYCKNPPQFKCISTQNWIWVGLAIAVYITELICRRCQGKEVEAIQLCIVPGKAVHLRLKVPNQFRIDVGQYVLLQCSKISSIEWHPFTVTKCPTSESQIIDVLISVRGDWTTSLYTLGKNPFSFDIASRYVFHLHHTPLKFLLDGPFASPMQIIKQCKTVICVAAGIGITAYISTLQSLMIENYKLPRRLHLLWLTKDPQQLMWYSKLLSDLLKKLWSKNEPDRLHIQFYLTKDNRKIDVQNLFDQAIVNRIRTGRPNWKEEFRIWDIMYRKKKVSFFCCGPRKLSRVLEKYCTKMNKKGNSFTFIQEGF